MATINKPVDTSVGFRTWRPEDFHVRGAGQPPAPATGQPALDQPAPDHPLGILDQQFQDLQDEFRPREQRLVGDKLPTKEHRRQISLLQREYDGRKSKLTQTRNALGVITRAVQNETIDEDAGKKAMFGLVLPREATDAMFPRPISPGAEPTPFSPSALKDVTEFAGEFADAAESEGDLIPFNRDPKNKDSLIKQYQEYQTGTGYHSDKTSTARRQQLDQVWDSKMRSGKQFVAWNATDVATLRPYKSRLTQQAAKLGSPLARGIARAKKINEGKKFGSWTPSIPDKPAAPGTSKKIGDILTKNGVKYKITGFDTDGDPLVDRAN